jgi:hypothetical protein
LTIGKSDSLINLAGLALGDVCVYEIHYSKGVADQRIWPTKVSNVAFTIVDGMAQYPLPPTGTV